MKYKFLTLALLPVLALTLTACSIQDLPLIGKFLGGKPAGVDLTKPVTLNVWGLWENPEVMQVLIKKYQDKYPNIKVNYEDRSVLNLNDYKQAVFTRTKGSETADIIRVHQSWVPKLTDNLNPAPDVVITADAFKNKFYPVATSGSVLENKVYAMPLYYDGLVLVYNKNHFEEIGQTEAPIAWEEFRRLASQLTIRAGRSGEDLIRAGAALGTADNNDMFPDILGLMFSQAGIKIPEEIDTKPAQDAFEFYTNFYKEDGVWSAEFSEATTAFAQGQVSMIFVPSWKLLSVLNFQGNLPSFEIGVAPVPQAKPQEPVSWSTYWVDVVPKTSKNSDVAWHFLNFLAEQEQQMELFNESSKYRQYGSPYSLAELGKELSGNEYLKPLMDTAAFAESGELTGRSGNDKFVNALRDAVNSVIRRENPENPANALRLAKEAMMR